MSGTIEGIYVVRSASGAPEFVNEANAVVGRGLEGDRYFLGLGTFFDGAPDKEVTLVEVEAIEALARDYGIELSPGDVRRNLLTRGVALNHLVGRAFQIGNVQLLGIRLCEPCSHLAGLTSQTVLKGLVHRGGLRAQITVGGLLHMGDCLRTVD